MRKTVKEVYRKLRQLRAGMQSANMKREYVIDVLAKAIATLIRDNPWIEPLAYPRRDRLTFRRLRPHENKMEYHTTPKLKGI